MGMRYGLLRCLVRTQGLSRQHSLRPSPLLHQTRHVSSLTINKHLIIARATVVASLVVSASLFLGYDYGKRWHAGQEYLIPKYGDGREVDNVGDPCLNETYTYTSRLGRC